MMGGRVPRVRLYKYDESPPLPVLGPATEDAGEIICCGNSWVAADAFVAMVFLLEAGVIRVLGASAAASTPSPPW